MKKSFNKKQTGLIVSGALALCFSSITAMAAVSQADKGYVVDPGNGVVWNSSGGCWRTGTGPAPAFREQCGQNSVPAPISKYIEPDQQPVAAAAPEPTSQVVVMAPKPAPVPLAERVALDADALFDFDKAVLRPAGRAALDDFVGKLVDIAPEMIMAIGYADRLGSEHYNQRLSEQRVEAVKAYLASKGIEPSRIHTEGMGEMQPVTKTDECDGLKGAELVACLQPDRRVVIEVKGARIARQ